MQIAQLMKKVISGRERTRAIDHPVSASDTHNEDQLSSVHRVDAAPVPEVYDEDGLRSIHNHDFMADPVFVAAYQRGLKANCGVDSLFRWRAHVVLWVADCANKLKGDFVECGVNKGFHSSAIMHHLKWNTLNRTFYLLDTFNGLDERFVSDKEKLQGKLELNQRILASGGYERNVDAVRANFSEWQRVRVIQGTVPETLSQVESNEVAYLHLDMNCEVPERAAAEFFWPRLVTGGFIILDDYAYHGYEPQKAAIDSFARARGVTVLSLPTGQGLIIKPPV
jgi:hypothetical protein